MATDITISTIIPIVTFILGFFASRLTMTKKERKDVASKLLENSNNLQKEKNQAFSDFTKAILKYANKTDGKSLDDFQEIATSGAIYFSSLKRICDSILANQVDESALHNTLIPDIREAVERSLPDYYQTLSELAVTLNIEYKGELRRENYESVYSVYEKYPK